MLKHLKKFQTHSNYEENQDKLIPNVSYCGDQNHLHYNSANANITFNGINTLLNKTQVRKGEPAELQIETPSNYYIYDISIVMGDQDITSTAWNQPLEKIVIDNVTDDIVINASARVPAKGQLYFDDITIMEPRDENASTSAYLKYHINTGANQVSNTQAFINLPNNITFGDGYEEHEPFESAPELDMGFINNPVKPYFYTAYVGPSPLTPSTDEWISSKELIFGYIPHGKYLNNINFNRGEISLYGVNNPILISDRDILLNVIPYERKVLNITDTEYASDEYNYPTRDIILNKTINANQWTGICLPFNLTQTQLEEAFGSDVQLGLFTSYDVDDGLILEFDKCDNSEGLSANTPYIIKCTSDKTEILFNDVIINPDEENAVIAYNTGRPGREQYRAYMQGTLVKQNVSDEWVLIDLNGNIITRQNAYDVYFGINSEYFDGDFNNITIEVYE